MALPHSPSKHPLFAPYKGCPLARNTSQLLQLDDIAEKYSRIAIIY